MRYVKCVIRINRKGVKLTPSEINSILFTVKSVGAELDGYTVYPNVIRIRIHSEIEAELCSKIEEKMLETFKRIIKEREEK